MTGTESIQRYLAGRDAPCPKCGYNLRGVAKAVCPECGQKLDRESVDVERRETKAFQVQVLMPCLAAIGMSVVIVGHTVWDWTRWGYTALLDQDLVFAYWLFSIGVVSIPVLTFARKRIAQRRGLMSRASLIALRILFPWGIAIGVPFARSTVQTIWVFYHIYHGTVP